MTTRNDQQTATQTLGETLKLGLSTWWREVKKLLGSGMRRFEISRLEKQLEEEYVTLGHIAESPRGKKQEKELCLKQIAFLKEEIETLRGEFEKQDGAK